ncbi:MBL fold metallo-hydrolase [Actinopolyspora sp. H202]|uniref:MBL fold metallo-hydrolase n=1 Tax=Actinopolyspora sp. H202 TaxID=1500456 RepID=UPI003EE555EB
MNRRNLLRSSAALGVAGAGQSVGSPGTAASEPTSSRRAPGSARLLWLGVAGWELSFAGHRLLVDPYMTRQEFTGPEGGLDLDRQLVVDEAAIDEIVAQHLAGPPEFVLLTHGHWDHIGDVPTLLGRTAWQQQPVRVLCGETHWHLLTAMGIPDTQQPNIVLVSGGEQLRYPLATEQRRPDYTIEVFRTLHSQVGGYGFAPAGTRTEPPLRPARLRDLVEGGSLAYQITIGEQLTVMFLSGTANFAEREVAGARPDVLVLGASGHAAVHDYYQRVLTALDWPEVVIPTHHDDLTTPLTSPDIHDTVDREQTRVLRDLLGKRGIALDPHHLEPIHL